MARIRRLLKATAAAVTIAAGMSLVPSAQAHSPSDPSAVGDVAKLSSAANLIIQGKVKKVSYRNHKIGGSEIPFAYVTIGVSKRLMGTSGNEITLRFVGGPNGRGGFVAAEGVPSFKVGDEDILFVKANGDNGCPLVMCEFGRFRLLNGQVFEAHGEPVRVIENGKLRARGNVPEVFKKMSYPAPSFDDLLKNPRVVAKIKKIGLTIEQARAKYEKEARKQVIIEEKSSFSDAGARTAPTPGLAVATVLSSISSAVANQRRAAPALIPDATPNGFRAPQTLEEASPK